MDVVSISIDVESRLRVAYNNLVAAGFDPASIDRKVLQAFGVVTASTAAPIVELNAKTPNRNGSNVIAGQELLQDNDGFVAVAAIVGLAKGAAFTDMAYARIYPYADIDRWIVSGNVNDAAQSIFTSGKVELKIGTRTAMQPRLLRYFEKPYNPQAAAATVATPPVGPNGGYTLLDKDYGMNGGNRNFLQFDLSGSVLTNIGAGTYLAVQIIGLNVVDQADRFTKEANIQNLCMV